MALYDWDEPRCLIENSETKGLHVNQDTMGLLRKVIVPVDVVAVVGPYRTGKSYLLNRLAGKSCGFDIGCTIQAKTKGIWVWCRPHPVKKNTSLLLVDSEGLGDPEKGSQDHDAWIFVLALLMSNTFVYNSMGTIDQDAIDKLHFVSDISELLKIKASTSDDDEEDNFDEYFPCFIWAVRDFHLKLEIDGKLCTSNDYMENALKIKRGATKKVMQFNLPRISLKRHFSPRRCFVFPRPINDERINHLESLSEHEIDEHFMSTVQDFLQHVNITSRVKTIDGVVLTGSGLANLCETYVKAIQNGAIPCIENAVDAMARAENSKAVDDAIQYYRTEMKKIVFPTETEEQLSIHHQVCEKNAIAIFMKASVFDKEQKYQKILVESIYTAYQQFYLENDHASSLKCKEILQSLYDPISAKMKSNIYMNPGGYQTYKNDMENLQIKYDSTSGKGVKALETIAAFMQEKATEDKIILMADEQLSQEQKKLNEEIKKAEEHKRQEEIAKAEKIKVEQLLKDKQASYDAHMSQLMEKHKQQIQNMRENLQEKMNKCQEEQLELMKNGFKEQADSLRGMVNDLTQRQQQMAIKAEREANENKSGSFLSVIGDVLGNIPVFGTLLKGIFR